jgi:hypothetical protein
VVVLGGAEHSRRRVWNIPRGIDIKSGQKPNQRVSHLEKRVSEKHSIGFRKTNKRDTTWEAKSDPFLYFWGVAYRLEESKKRIQS